MEETNVAVAEAPKKKTRLTKIVKGLTIIVLAFSLGYVHYYYVSHLFENTTHFSYLSELEREMLLRTEMGFYYSYYKTVVEEKPFILGISKLMYDRIVEYPNEVNAFNRFNIHPEVVIASIYHYLSPSLNTSTYRQCHMVDRGPDLPPVESCVGLGHPIFLYLETIWWFAGLTVTALFLYATVLSESILGGLLAVAQYFANHAEATRVQWCPNERENFALPLLLLQTWLVTMQLRDTTKRVTIQLVSVFILNCLCLLFWQFTQFIFLTQMAIFFVMEQLKIIDARMLSILLHSHFCGLHMAILLLQGNDMLKTSLYSSFFLIVSAYCMLFSSLRIKVRNYADFLIELFAIMFRIIIVVIASFYLKKFLSNLLEVEEDTHIWEILSSKIGQLKSFHSLIYTCSEAFDFLPISTVYKLTKSLLIPFALIGILNVCATWFLNAKKKYIKKVEDALYPEDGDGIAYDSDESDSGIENSDSRKKNTNLDLIDEELKEKETERVEKEEGDLFVIFWTSWKIEPAIFYNISQLVVFGVMAGLVMRLKLLFVTQLCIVSSLFMNSEFYTLPKKFRRFVPLFWAVCAPLLAHILITNVSQELSHIGEFSDVAQEQLMEWIRSKTPATAAFAGSMPLLASVMLITRRPIVIHPHYEHKAARDRVYAVYKMYGRFPPQELYQELSNLKATYLIVESKYCYGKSTTGCSFDEIWQSELGHAAERPLLCRLLLTERVEHFYPLYRNSEYAVFRVHDLSVRYMPRSFDT